MAKKSRLKNMRFWAVSAISLMVFCFLFLTFAPSASAGSFLGARPLTEELKVSSSLHDLWKFFMTTVNSLIIVLLIVVAFAEILRININTYGVKKILPTLVLAVIAANFSWIICRLIVDISYVARTMFTDNGGLFANVFQGARWTDSQGWTTAVPRFISAIIRLIYDILVLVAIVLLWLLFWVRNWVIMTLAILSPIAFMAMVLPQTKSLFTRWWTEMLRWTFMPVVSYFFIWLGARFLQSLSPDPLYAMLVAGVCLYGAIITPFKLGGVVMAPIGKLANMGLKKGQSKWVDPAIKEMKDAFMEKYLGTQDEEGGFRGGWKKGGLGGAIKGAAGYMVRRAERVKFRRSEQARAVEGKLDSAVRAAFGGKYGQFNKELEGWVNKSVPKSKRTASYVGEDGQIHEELLTGAKAIAYRTDSINGDFGEKDWIHKKNLGDFFEETESGKQAMDRSVQYAFRVGAEDARMKALRMESELLAYHYTPDMPNRYHDNTMYGYGEDDDPRRHHFSLMQARKQEWDGRLLWMDMMRQKTEGDALTADMQNAIPLNRFASNFQYLRQMLTDDDALPVGHADKLTAEERADAAEAMELLREAYRNMASHEVITDNVRDGRLVGGNLPTVRAMTARADGTFSDDIEDCQLMQTLAHVQDENLYMFEGREAKRWTARAKEEISSEQGKRTSIQSGQKGWDHKKYSDTATDATATEEDRRRAEERLRQNAAILNGDLTAIPAGHPLEVAIAQWRNLSTAATRPGDTDYRPALTQYFIPNVAYAAQQANGQLTREMMAQAIKIGVEQGLSNSNFSGTIKSAFVEEAVKTRRAAAEARSALPAGASEDDKKAHKKELDDQDEAYRKEIAALDARALHERVSTDTGGTLSLLQQYQNKMATDLGAHIDALGSHAQLGFTDAGQVTIKINQEGATTEAERSALVGAMESVWLSLASQDPSDRNRGAFSRGQAAGASQKNVLVNNEPGVRIIEGADAVGKKGIVAKARKRARAEGGD
jgi:hypothetical protein